MYSSLALKPEEWLNWADSIDLNLDIRGTSFPEIDGVQASVTYPIIDLMNIQVNGISNSESLS